MKNNQTETQLDVQPCQDVYAESEIRTSMRMREKCSGQKEKKERGGPHCREENKNAENDSHFQYTENWRILEEYLPKCYYKRTENDGKIHANKPHSLLPCSHKGNGSPMKTKT